MDVNLNKLIAEIKDGTHKQFVYNPKSKKVECRCGQSAIWWKTLYVCPTASAYPCDYTMNKKKP